MRRAAEVMVLASVLLAATARAQPSQPSEPDPEVEPAAPLVQPAQPPADELVTSYRPWTMTADVISLGLIVGGFSMDGNHFHDTSDAIITTGVLGGFVASPLIHAARGHYLRALGSFALRGWIAGTGAMIGVATADCRSALLFCGLDRMPPGMIAGFAIAMVIDNVWLTDEHVPRNGAAPAWAPVVAPGPGGGTVGVVASW
jgi:hypothetical protein